MATDSGKKLFVGPRFRRIRQQLGLSQTQIAEDSAFPRLYQPDRAQPAAGDGADPAAAGGTYDLDLRDLATADEDRFFAELNEIFSDPLFRQIDLPKQELRDLRRTLPRRDALPAAIVRRLYRGPPRRDHGGRAIRRPRGRRPLRGNPIERVRDLIEANRNYFPSSNRPPKACATN